MADTLSSEKRSKNMSAIKNRNTTPEQMFRKWLFNRGYRYRTNVKYVYGCPDLFLRKYNTAIFVNGCFWHRHKGCKYAYTPKSRVEFWLDKFDRNIKRDIDVYNELSVNGIKCLVIWECTVRSMQKDLQYRNEILNAVELFLLNNAMFCEI